MKLYYFSILLLFSLLSCDDGFNCPDFVESQHLGINKLFELRTENLSGTYEKDKSFNFDLTVETAFDFDADFDENGCFIGGQESFEYEYKDNQNKRFAIVEITPASQDGLFISNVAITVSSKSDENNTFNLFEYQIREDASPVEASHFDFYPNYELAGQNYNDVLEFTRSPRLPESDLNEITRLIFSFDNGILATYNEDGQNVIRK